MNRRPQKRDHTGLICSIGELSGLFTDASSLDGFLQKIPQMIADHMESAVCSIYLYYEETQELVLTATKGLKPEAIGRVRLKLGEGLTGRAVKELRAICETNASRVTGYRYFPEIGEEAYESFLAVPILRGQTRVGALVIQDLEKNSFTDEDVKAIRAISSQLANTIETAKLLMDLDRKKKGKGGEVDLNKLKFVKGRVGSEGFARGETVVYDATHPLVTHPGKAGQRYSLKDFHLAVQTTEKQLENFQKEIEEKLSDVASLIFTAQILMLKDKAFIDAIVEGIHREINPPEAIIQTVEQYVQKFQALSNEYLREKQHDVRDIGNRLLENLIGVEKKGKDYRNRIVIARELYPSDILKLSSQETGGIVLLSGGITSHIAILARSLMIPLIISNIQEFLHLPSGTPVILDAEQGNIYINPSEDVRAGFKGREDDRQRMRRFQETAKDKTLTKDGSRVVLLSNINLLSDLNMARAVKSEGVGLYRSEFPFIVRSDFPSEEEQYIVYKKLAEGMPGKELTIRTLDIGGDKMLSYYDYGKEENPFLGMRSIRFSLKHRHVFRQQLRAILRAGVEADLRIMFPMISSIDEFLEAKAEVAGCMVELAREKVAHHTAPKVGMMVELPAVIEIIDELAKEADFFSIGTNDFIQYMLAVDRTNEKVADLYLPHHPSILRAFKKVVEAAQKEKIDVSVCGDMAHDVRYIPYFLGIGIRKFSLDSRAIPKIQQCVEAVDLKQAQRETKELLTRHRVSELGRIIGQANGG